MLFVLFFFFFLSCRCAVFHVQGLCGEAQGIVRSCLKSLSWWWPVHCSSKPPIEGLLRKTNNYMALENCSILFMVHCAEPGSLRLCPGGAGIGVSLIDTTTSQFLGDIVECNPSYLPLQLSPKTDDFFCCCCPKP